MNIIFMGTPEFAVPSLQALIDADYNIQLVVTQPDKKGNRGKIIPSPVKQLALEHGIEVAQPVSIRKDEDFLKKVEALNPDLIVVAAFGQILPERVLKIPNIDCINVHGSLLPQLRGAAPMQAAILQGLQKSGVTIMKMEKGLDTGDMISKVECDIKGLNITEVAEILSQKGGELLINTLPSIIDGSAEYVKQDEKNSTYAHMMKKTDGLTSFDESAEILERKIRAYYEWPTLYSYLDGQQVKFYKAIVLEKEPDGKPGTISAVNKNDYVINCADGQLMILEQQLQGKKRMSAGDFLRGRKITVGERFCAEEV